jgi:peptidoglycan/xylan/chitin deacetylase (PgdA/CDA1 family)
MRWAARLGLTYHAITDRWDNELALPPSSFEAQVRRIARAGYRGVTFSSLAAEPSARGVVAVTFDDGFSSVYEHAAPLLEELGWPATVFVTTGAVERDEPMRWLLGAGRPEPHDVNELQPLTWEQLESLAARGWEIGSHSVSHPLLSTLVPAERHEELVVSRTVITEHVGACISISYPWGEVNDVVAEAARHAGYTAGGGLAGRFRLGDPMRVPRFAVARRDDGLRIALKTSAPVWAARRSPLWTALSRLRHARAAGPMAEA